MYRLNSIPYKGEQYKTLLNQELLNPRDTFGRNRTSTTNTIFESNADFIDDIFHFNLLTSNTASITRNNDGSYYDLAVNASGDKAIRQSRYYLTYMLGCVRSTFIGCTPLVTSGNESNYTIKIGVFDDDIDKTSGLRGGDGYFFQKSGGVNSFVCRSSVSGSQVDTVVTQSNWNSDKLNGTGYSQCTLDTSKLTAVVVEDTCSDIGTVRVGFVIDGRIIYCHHFVPSGNKPPVKTSRLPIRYEIVSNSGGSTSASLYATTACSFIETGLYITRGLRFSFTMTTPKRVSNGPLLSIRCKSTCNRSSLMPKRFCLMSTNEMCPYAWKILINTTLTGATWDAFINPYSVCELDTSATSYSGGFEASGGLIATGDREAMMDALDNFCGVGSTIEGVGDTATLVIISLSLGNVDMLGSIEFMEDR